MRPQAGTIDRRARVLIAVTIACNLAYGLSMFTVHTDHTYETLWDGWVYTAASALPAVLTGVWAWRHRAAARGWWWITAGSGLNVAANLIYTYHDQNLRPIPYPGLSDIPWLAGYVAYAIGLVLLTFDGSSERSTAKLMDALTVGLSGGAVVVALWFQSVLDQSGDVGQVLVSLAYPVFDLIFVVIVLSGIAYQRFRPTPTNIAILAGAAIFAYGDIVYLNQIATDTYLPNTPLELTWVFGTLLFGMAPWIPRRLPRPQSDATSTALEAVPGLAALASLLVIVYGLQRQVPALAIWLAVAAVALALVQMIYTVRALRRANVAFSQARTDDLTALMNRRGFVELVDGALADDEGSVLVVDLDGFKEVNDSLGHHAGDVLLTIVGERFRRALGDDAVVARLGGDEFGVFTAGDDTVAVGLGRRLIASLTNPVTIDDIAIRVGASIGIATSPWHGTNRAELLRAADVAMYDAKHAQRDLAIYTPQRDPHSRERLSFIEELRQAIEARSFEIHYQPTIDIRSRSIVGLEALIRWRHPERGLLLPEEFIPLAESVGLLQAITRAVVDQALRDLMELDGAGGTLRMSVNVSASDLVDEDLPRYVVGRLDAYGLDRDRLTIEITETALARDPARARRALDTLRAAGVRVSIDDFGVGYSSMSQLMELPVDELKLDRSFVTHLTRDVRAQAIVSATVELGHTLGLAVVVEGVEDEAVLADIGRRGADVAQGFLFSPAVPMAELRAVIADPATLGLPRPAVRPVAVESIS